MQVNNSFTQKRGWLGQVTCLLLLTSAIAACENQNTAVNPTPEVTPTVVVTPTPAPTTVVVTPSPVPANTIVATPVPSPTAASPGAIATPDTQTTPTANPVAGSSEPITDVSVITNTSDRQSILNKQVQLTNVTVQTVNGDRTFWIGQPNGQPVFVVLEPPLDAGSAENKIVIKPGQTLNLTGVLKPLPTDTQAQQQWGLSPAETQRLQNQALYLQAGQVQFQ
ncbi:hypothetical protein ACE1B6_04775 [Aerosakkonemataceae cyanobacterium BLCC-F154]|uniref:Uncharacterized protein n=1 Tax=Floridaenema fluviatile BLCC-F154 TaxID=3153640 RepID=A0ABV4Y6Y5_9CYAN